MFINMMSTKIAHAFLFSACTKGHFSMHYKLFHELYKNKSCMKSLAILQFFIISGNEKHFSFQILAELFP